MKTMVVYASRHSSTGEIAGALAQELHLAGRSVTARPVVEAPEGDYRDWDAIRGWAREIAMALPALAIPAP